MLPIFMHDIQQKYQKFIYEVTYLKSVSFIASKNEKKKLLASLIMALVF